MDLFIFCYYYLFPFPVICCEPCLSHQPDATLKPLTVLLQWIPGSCVHMDAGWHKPSAKHPGSPGTPSKAPVHPYNSGPGGGVLCVLPHILPEEQGRVIKVSTSCLKHYDPWRLPSCIRLGSCPPSSRVLAVDPWSPIKVRPPWFGLVLEVRLNWTLGNGETRFVITSHVTVFLRSCEWSCWGDHCHRGVDARRCVNWCPHECRVQVFPAEYCSFQMILLNVIHFTCQWF